MLRSIRIAVVFRLLAWTCFAASLAFIAWSLYVILPPNPRWVVPEREVDLGCDDIPIYVSENGSGSQFSPWRLFAAGFGSRRVRYCVRDLRDGSVRAEGHDALYGDRKEVFFCCQGRLRGFGLPGGKFLDLPLSDFVAPFAEPIDSAKVSPEGDLLVLTAYDREKKPRCIILDVNDGRVLESVNRSDGQSGVDACVYFTPHFVICMMPSEKKMVLWDRHKRAVHRDYAFSESEAVHLKDLEVCGNALVLLEATAEGSAFVLRDLPEMRERTELFRAKEGDCWFRCSPDGELIVTGSSKGTVARIWHIRSKKLFAELSDFPRVGDPERCWSVFFSRDSRFIAALDSSEEAVFDAQNGARLWAEKRNLPEPLDWLSVGLTESNDTLSRLYFDSRTGRNRYPSLEDARDYSISRNGRFMVSVAYDDSKSDMLEALKNWLPGWLFDRLQGGSELRFQVADLENDSVRKCSIRVPYKVQIRGFTLRGQPTVTVSDEGEAAVIANTHDETDTITCWDVPAKRRWEWIIGVPAALAIPVVAWRLCRWRTAARPPTKQAACVP
ncbi:MAG: WD40 repeat domain-containing protein [Planctomycetes bacterium]|nr:WD40 repeat domain-containing protein [Planctomycetota bacterium]